nr:unnamed protein product [Callosobruchus analis]
MLRFNDPPLSCQAVQSSNCINFHVRLLNRMRSSCKVGSYHILEQAHWPLSSILTCTNVDGTKRFRRQTNRILIGSIKSKTVGVNDIRDDK